MAQKLVRDATYFNVGPIVYCVLKDIITKCFKEDSESMQT